MDGKRSILTHYAPDATPENLADNDKLAQFDYTVREDGRRTAATETFWLDGIAKENQLTWAYDDTGRLIDEVFYSYDNALDRAESFVYDLVGNRLRQDVDLGNDSDIDERTLSGLLAKARQFEMAQYRQPLHPDPKPKSENEPPLKLLKSEVDRQGELFE